MVNRPEPEESLILRRALTIGTGGEQATNESAMSPRNEGGTGLEPCHVGVTRLEPRAAGMRVLPSARKCGRGWHDRVELSLAMPLVHNPRGLLRPASLLVPKRDNKPWPSTDRLRSQSRTRLAFCGAAQSWNDRVTYSPAKRD